MAVAMEGMTTEHAATTATVVVSVFVPVAEVGVFAVLVFTVDLIQLRTITVDKD